MAGKSAVRTDRAPAPVQDAPYSQAIRFAGLIFVSGQIALRPGTTQMAGTTIQEQTAQALANLGAILEAAGSGLERVVKTTVFLRHMSDFAAMNDVYRRVVGAVPPARSTVEVSALPNGALVEIDAIASA